MVAMCLFLILLLSIKWGSGISNYDTRSAIEQCEKEFNITVNDREDPNFDCMVNCFLIAMEFIDKQGNTSIEQYRKYTGLPIEFLDEEYIHFCEKVYSNYSSCAKIHRTHLCILNYLYKN